MSLIVFDRLHLDTHFTLFLTGYTWTLVIFYSFYYCSNDSARKTCQTASTCR